MSRAPKAGSRQRGGREGASRGADLRSRAFPLVIAAPSGAGKTSIAQALVRRNADIVFSISATTRPRRPHEEDGRDYHFVGGARFEEMAAGSELVEWAEVHGNRYGTPREAVRATLEAGNVVLLDIDVQGARQIREAFGDAVLVFILPPSADELSRRLSLRGSERGDERRRRLANARQELGAALEFDYIVVNERLEDAIELVESIVAAERSRRTRFEGFETHVAALDSALAEILERSD